MEILKGLVVTKLKCAQVLGSARFVVKLTICTSPVNISDFTKMLHGLRNTFYSFIVAKANCFRIMNETIFA
jgi:hypothetical protein